MDRWTEQDSLRLSVVMGLRKGLSLCRGMRRTLTEDEQRKIAEEIIKHLDESNWKITLRPPLGACPSIRKSPSPAE
jgi:hypothetical protein